MMTLFDEETIRKNHEASVAREYISKGVAKGIEKGIQSMVRFCQSRGESRADAIEAIAQNFELEPEMAAQKVDLYWIDEP